MKLLLAIAALAAALSTAAFAGDGKPVGPGVQNRTLQVTTEGAAPQSGQFHQNNQSGTGPDHTKLNCVANPGTVNC